MNKMSLKGLALAIVIIAGLSSCRDIPQQATIDRVYGLQPIKDFNEQLTSLFSKIVNLDTTALSDDFIIQDTTNNLSIYNISVKAANIQKSSMSSPANFCEVTFTSDLYATYKANTNYNAQYEGTLEFTLMIPSVAIQRVYDHEIQDYNFIVDFDPESIAVPPSKEYFPIYTGDVFKEEINTLLLNNLNVFSNKTSQSFQSNLLSIIPIYLNQRSEINFKSGKFLGSPSRKINLVRNRPETCQDGYQRNNFGAYLSDNYGSKISVGEINLDKSRSDFQQYFHYSLIEEFLAGSIQNHAIKFTLANNNPPLPIQSGYKVRSLSIVYPSIARYYSPNQDLIVECEAVDINTTILELSCDFVFEKFVHLNFKVKSAYSIKTKVEDKFVKFYFSSFETIDITLDKDLGGSSSTQELATVIDKLLKDYLSKQQLGDLLIAELEYPYNIKIADSPEFSGVIISKA